MPRHIRPLFPSTQRRATALGERLRTARLRRGMSVSELAVRVDASRATLTRLERGEMSVSLALLLRVLGILGLEGDIDRVAEEDELGRRLQDIGLRRPRRAADQGPPHG